MNAKIYANKEHYLNAIESCNETSARKILKTFNRNRRKIFPYTVVYNSSETKKSNKYFSKIK